VCSFLSLRAAFGGEAIPSLQRHSHESGNPVPLLKFLSWYLPSNGHSGTAEEFMLPCYSEPQAKNLFSIEILRHGLKSHSSE